MVVRPPEDVADIAVSDSCQGSKQATAETDLEDARVREILSDSKMREILMDSKVQQLMTLLRNDPEKAQVWVSVDPRLIIINNKSLLWYTHFTCVKANVSANVDVCILFMFENLINF